jgi:N-acyl-D-amino-acid deacylase
MLEEPLDFEPGTRYAYSNFGYCLLGRVIEKLSGQDYEAYVREAVLEPLGIESMQLGRTRLAGRAESEVRYYDPNRGPSVFQVDLGEECPSAYGAWHLENMDAHGGWLASADDLIKFAAAFDDPEHCRVLEAESIQRMFSRPDNGVYPSSESNGGGDYYYALGWCVRPQSGADEDRLNTWHTGSLPGTSTLMVRRHDGLAWVLLFNARQHGDVRHLTRLIDPLLHQAADEVKQWP